MIKYTAWIGRDNTIDFALLAGDPLTKLSATDMALITKYGFTYHGVEYLSDKYPGLFQKTVSSATLKFKPGLITEAPDGSVSDLGTPGYDTSCELVVYSDVNPEGLIWGPQFKLTMKQD